MIEAIESYRDPGEVKGIAYKKQGRLASILIYEQMDFCRSSWFGEQWLESLLD